MRSIVEAVAEADAIAQAVAVSESAANTAFSTTSTVRCYRRCTAGRPRSPPVGEAHPTRLLVFTVQGDGDMVNEGLQEVVHLGPAASRSPVHVEQRGFRRNRRPHDGQHRARPAHQEHAGGPRRRGARLPDPDGNLLAGWGVAYVARGAVNSHVNVNRTKKMIQRALAVQQQRLGFSSSRS